MKVVQFANRIDPDLPHLALHCLNSQCDVA